MKEKRNITIIDKKNIPTEEPARQYYFMDIAKEYVRQLAEEKGAPLTFCVNTFGCQMNARDSEKLVGILKRIGYVEVDTEKADFGIENPIFWNAEKPYLYTVKISRDGETITQRTSVFTWVISTFITQEAG